MARSWASVARGSALRAEAPEYTPDATAPTGGWEGAEWKGYLTAEQKRIDKIKKVWADMDVKYGLPPRCHDCQAAAELCANGCPRPPTDSWKGKQICGRCYYDAMDRLGSDCMSTGILAGYDAKNDPPFLCHPCSCRHAAAEEAARDARDAAAAKVFKAETPARVAAEAAAEKVRADYYAAVEAELAHSTRLWAPARYKVIDWAHDHRRRNQMHADSDAAYKKTFEEEKARLGL